MRHRNTLIATLLAAPLVVGCSFTQFDDLEKEAPAHRVVQESESDGFGRPLVGLTRLNEEPGGQLLIAGTGGNPVLFTGTFNATGGLSSAQTSRESFDEKLGLKGFGVRAMAAAPPDKALPNDNLPGPFAYVGATGANSGRVVIVDVNSYKAPLQGGILTETRVPEFGISLAAAKWGPTADEDLVVGAAGRIFFLRATPWPSFDIVPDQGYRPSDDQNDTRVYETLAVGDLDKRSAEDEVVVAAPKGNYVAVVHGVSSCFGGSRKSNANDDGGAGDGAVDAGASDSPDSGSPDGGAGSCSAVKHFQLALPSDANGFGKALLIADVDEDGDPELLVGAPDTKGGGAVYVYDFKASDFDNNQPNAPSRVISAPEGVTGFGSSLAFGAFDGQGKPLLAVGAPTSTNDGTDNAGKIVIYRIPDLGAVVNTLRLSSPENADLLGAALTVMPFRKGAEIKRVLAASVNKGTLVMFANVTSDHKDFRE